MTAEQLRELRLLNEIASGTGGLTQRRLAKAQGLALGLANLLIRRLVMKGYVKIENAKGKRLRYLLTPLGAEEKTNLTDAYFNHILYSYREIRRFFTSSLTVFSQTNRRNILIVGTGEVAEIAYLTLRALDLNLAGIVDESTDGPMFFRCPVRPLSALADLSFDGVIIAAMKDRYRLRDRLKQAGIPEENTVTIPDSLS